eukprot:TRINITY_DN8717_c0_g1_i1.p1 TRINITY_DN8717_c0_g1~~TRINITY_DN8717_c0_g1_i1.p1  ORF type:complete len:540 (+),score=133.34 TRINITY_DN8717_c0_g1_i1:62-1621(+)
MAERILRQPPFADERHVYQQGPQSPVDDRQEAPEQWRTSGAADAADPAAETAGGADKSSPCRPCAGRDLRERAEELTPMSEEEVAAFVLQVFALVEAAESLLRHLSRCNLDYLRDSLFRLRDCLGGPRLVTQLRSDFSCSVVRTVRFAVKLLSQLQPESQAPPSPDKLKRLQHIDVLIQRTSMDLKFCKQLTPEPAEYNSVVTASVLEGKLTFAERSGMRRVQDVQLPACVAALKRDGGAPFKRIRNPAVEAWWQSAFGSALAVCDWQQFWRAMTANGPGALLQPETAAAWCEEERLLRMYIDFGNAGAASLYGLLLFACWFGPLDGALNRLQTLMSERVFFGFLGIGAASGMLGGKEPGTYMLRFSNSKPGSFAVDFVIKSRSRGTEVKHCLAAPVDAERGLFNLDFESLGFGGRSVHADIVQLHRLFGKRLSDYNEVPELRPQQFDYAPYITSGAEDTTCRVCFTRTIDVINIPCGHMCCCAGCAKAVEPQGCPLCRSSYTWHRVFPAWDHRPANPA